MCKICGFLACSGFEKKMTDALKREESRMGPSLHANESILLKTTQEPLREQLLSHPIFEVRVGHPTPLRYYQDLYIDGERWPIVWRHDSFRTITVLEDGALLLLSKHPAPYERMYTHYIVAVIEKGRYEYILEPGVAGNGSSTPGFITIRFDGTLSVKNLKNKNIEEHHVSFAFFNHPFHYVSKRESMTTVMKEAHRFGKLKTALSKFEDYVVTVPHYSLHPYMLNEYKRCGYKRRTTMQKEGPLFFFEHLHR